VTNDAAVELGRDLGNDAGRLAAATSEPWRRGTVQAIVSGPPPLATVRPQGLADSSADTDMPYLDSYSPVVGDLVFYSRIWGSPFVVGRVQAAQSKLENFHLMVAGTTDTTPGTSYADRTGVLVTLQKALAGTRIIVRLDLSCYTITTSSLVTFGVSVAGTDYDICRYLVNANSTRGFPSAERALPAGIAAGTQVIQLRVKAASGTTVVRQDTGDYVSLSAEERV
jgi:hypothetical protein